MAPKAIRKKTSEAISTGSKSRWDNAVRAAGNTVLHVAALGVDGDIVAFLIKNGAEVNGCDNYGKTPLHCAARKGRTEIATRLIKHGASVNAMAQNGSFPLDWAIKFEHEDVATLLRAHGGKNGKALK